MGDRVQRPNPLRRIEREFLFEGDMSYVAMGTWGMNSGLCELQLRQEARVRLRDNRTSPLNHRINHDTRWSDTLALTRGNGSLFSYWTKIE